MKTDLSYLESMAEGDPGLIREMIGIFSTQVAEFSSLMQVHLEKKDWQELGKLAHKAKSSVAIMGMKELAEKLNELEILTQDGRQVQSYPGYIDLFLAASEDAVNELNIYLANR